MKFPEETIGVWRAVGVPVRLVAAHIAAATYVEWRHIEYDTNGLEGPLWWLVNFWVLPILAVLLLAWHVVKKLMS